MKEGQPQESEELFEHHSFVADKGQEPLRIDKFLIDRVPNTSRNRLQIAAKNGNILVNNSPVKSNYKIRPNDKVSIVLPYPIREIELIPENIPIDIVYEDEDLLVLNKQAGIVVHPGYGNYSGTLVNALVYHFENLPSSSEYDSRPGLVHRLDKNTTGIMVVAKSENALTHLAKQFFNRTSDRRYYALVWGDVLEDAGTVEGKVGRSVKNRKIMDVFDDDSEYGKPAVTHYEVIQRFGYVTLIKCKLETGRTHQIRIHMKHIGHPLFGDPEYGGNKILKGTTFSKYKQFIENCFSILPRQALHAKTLGFEHPVTNEWMSYESDLPEDMKLVLEKWSRYSTGSN
ncbi:MAG: RluA family pseudouridine synthase [Crocinitomicaceae bacterium]|jgi:23S rRNA pseudouridine1911/1915/1917 synthase|nr:RluA family pseudouridine synthase [Crocinitomicaceae bacterium]MBT5402998.1 RluA family pseudouridine synthase [Crocinitomicaceae bacterium]MBT6030367.1 RluA family pseudouridine synthase [Crocinitomicaceae bacterium]MBT6515128.1 RluA family pseudouridine synthase [Crocinitomicaceae bacterium]MDG2330871.1 RluA family pseudouridine synthase [Flavobacteriales bacterium]